MITEDQRDCFQQQGYIVLEKILSEPLLKWLQSRCDEAVDWKASRMRYLGIEEEGINLLVKRYFVSGYRKQNSEQPPHLKVPRWCHRPHLWGLL